MNRVARAAQARHVANRQHAVVHRMAGLLLDYPTVELLALLPTVRSASAELDERLRLPLLRVVDHLEAHPLAELEAEYVATFDHRRRCALYLTYYSYGDTRKRGVALVTFKQAQAEASSAAMDELTRESEPLRLGTDQLVRRTVNSSVYGASRAFCKMNVFL